MKSRVLAIFIALIATAALAAEAPQPGAFRLRLTADPQTLDWNLARTSYETHVIMNLMEGLTEEGPDLNPVPALAEHWEISTDGRTYTFYLRDGIVWSDGKKLRAQDFVDSWIRLLDPKTRSSYAEFLFDVQGAEAFHKGKGKVSDVGVKAVSDQKFEVRLTHPVPHFLHLPSFWVTFPIRAELIHKYGTAWTDPKNLVTLGPFVLKSWKRGSELELARNSKYFGGDVQAGGVQAVVAKIIPDDARAREQFESGGLDVLLDATTADLVKSPVGRSDGVRAEQYPYLSTHYLAFKVDSPLLKDSRLRRAIALALASERARIPASLQGGQLPASGWVPPGMPGHREDTALQGTLFDARALLSQAGYGEGHGLPRLQLWVERFDGSDRLANLVREILHEKLGLELDVKASVEPAAFETALKAGQAPLYIKHWGADYPDPANFLEVFEGASGSNRTGWKNAEYDALLKRARAALDGHARIELLAQAEKILLQQDCAIFPLFYKRNTALLGARVKQFSISPLNYLFFKQVRLQ